MKVHRVRIQGQNMIEPVDNKILFNHCSDGALAVTKKIFDKEVTPLLFLPGVVMIEYV